MNIYIDESGVFVCPDDSTQPSISAVGALVVPQRTEDAMLAQFVRLKRKWGVAADEEIKGSSLNEKQVHDAITIVRRNEGTFDATVIDMSIENSEGITEHKLQQANLLTASLTDEYKPQLVQSIEEAADQLRESADQLYVQSVCANELIWRVIQNVTLHYALYGPEELGAFRWRIDAKDKVLTAYEDLWSKLIGGSLQSKAARSPFISVNEGDYSHFERFHGTHPKTPDYLVDLVGEHEPFHFLEISTLWSEDRAFVDSKDELGVQLADILVTSLRRAMSGTLRARGWSALPSLMFKAKRGEQVPQMASLTYTGAASPKYAGVFHLCAKYAKPVLKE